MENKPLRILLAGPSGVGKTTVAKYISDKGIKFLSGSVSDLLPKTKEMPHADMLARDPKELYMEDFQILNLRNKLFSSEEESFVSDRSFLDSAAYFLYKQADKIPACEVEHFLELTKMATLKNSDYLIFFEFTQDMFNNWVIEDNQKRVTSKYFQMEISQIMSMVLELWGVKWGQLVTSITYKDSDILSKILGRSTYLDNGIRIGTMENLYGKTKVVLVREANKQIRERIINVLFQNEKL